MPIDIAAQCNAACRDVIQTFRDALACGVVDLSSTELVCLHHVFPSMSGPEIQLLCDGVAELVDGPRLQLFDRVLSRRVRGGEQPFEPPHELFLDTASALVFLKSIHKHRLVVFLIAKRSTSQGVGWLRLRKVVGQLRKAVTQRVVLKKGIPGLQRRAAVPAEVTQRRPRRAVSHAATTLSGELAQFGLTSVFQLLGQQKKSGRLLVEAARRELSIMLDHGQVISAWDYDKPPSDGLESLLLRSLQLSEPDIRKVRRRSTFRNLSLEDALLEMGLAEPAQVDACGTQLILERVYQAFQWTQGRYNFFPDTMRFEGRRCPPVDVERVLFKVALIADEMPRLRALFPHDGIQLRAAVRLPRRNIQPLEGDLRDLFHSLPAGVLSLKEVYARVSMPSFETMQLLRELHERGYLEVESGPAEELEEPQEAPAVPADPPSESSRALRKLFPTGRHLVPRKVSQSGSDPALRKAPRPGSHTALPKAPQPVPQPSAQRTAAAGPSRGGAEERPPPPASGPPPFAASAPPAKPASEGLVPRRTQRISGEHRLGVLDFTPRGGEPIPSVPEKPRTMTMRLDAIRAAARKPTPVEKPADDEEAPEED